jgi:PAS domain S-box-containing protein
MHRARSAESRLNAPERLAALEATGLLEAEGVEIFERLARTAAHANRAPVAQVNLVTSDRQVPVACFGPEPWNAGDDVSLEFSFCQHVVASGQPLVVEDARRHPLTRESRATTESGVVSYASVPLTTAKGLTLGSLCVVDFRPRVWTEEEMVVLRDLAEVATAEIDDRIRSHQRSRAAVRESETRFGLLVEAVREYGIFMLDPAGHVVSWSPGAERISGFTEAEIVGRHFSTFYTEDDRARFHPQEELRIARDHGHVAEEGWRVRKDGTLFWASVTITAIHDDDGRLLGFGKVTRDLTDRKKAEEDLLAAKNAAERANRIKSEFLATMSHELRTPLNAVICYADLLASGIPVPIPAEAGQQVERIAASARHLFHLIEEILLFSRIEAGSVTLEPAEVEMRTILADVATMIEPLADGQGLSFRMEVPDEPVVLRTDAGRLKQVLLNLLDNAIKFTKKGEVSCRGWCEGDEAVFEVRDTGPGIPSSEVERIFEPFVQADQGITREVGGTGLGLTVARRLARLLGGDILVNGTEGEGAVFRVRVPREMAAGAP